MSVNLVLGASKVVFGMALGLTVGFIAGIIVGLLIALVILVIELKLDRKNVSVTGKVEHILREKGELLEAPSKEEMAQQDMVEEADRNHKDMPLGDLL